MAVAQFSHMEGGAEMAAVFRELPVQLAKNALLSTGRAGAKVLRDAALVQLGMYMRKRAPREDDVVVRQSRLPSDQLAVEFRVGPPRRKPWLRWLHDGTAPHRISAREKIGTRRGRRNVVYGTRETLVLASRIIDRFFGIEVNHPGQPPRPWLFAAQWGSGPDVIRAMGEQIRKALPKQAKRLVSQKYRDQQLRKWLR